MSVKHTTIIDPQVQVMVVIDCETTGRDAVNNNLMCFAVVIVDMLANRKVAETVFHILPPDGVYNWEERCLDEFWDKKENIGMKKKLLQTANEHGTTARLAMHNFWNWVKSLTIGSNATVFFDTVSFDVTFMNVYLANANLPPLDYIFGEYKAVRDSTSFHAGVAHCLPSDGQWGMEERAVRRLGGKIETLDANPYKPNHDPLIDANSIAWEIMFITNLIKSSRGEKVVIDKHSFCGYAY